jgi:hypothetical protein
MCLCSELHKHLPELAAYFAQVVEAAAAAAAAPQAAAAAAFTRLLVQRYKFVPSCYCYYKFVPLYQ